MRHAAGDIDEHVVGDEVQAGAFLENREEQRQPILIDADGHPPGHAVADVVLTSACTSTSIGREPSRQHNTAEPGVAVGRSARNSADGLGTGRRPAPVISKTPSSLIGAKAVLHRADDAMRVMPLAFEVEHRVDDVLERLRAGEVAVLRDVADQERRDVVALRGEQELRRRFAHLADAAGRRLELQREHRLHRIDDRAARA